MLLLIGLVFAIVLAVWLVLRYYRAPSSSPSAASSATPEAFENIPEERLSDDEMLSALRLAAKIIRPDLDEKIVITIGSKSETFDKKDIRICIRNEDSKMYPFKVLMYVLLHEMAHVITSTMSGYGDIPHDDRFSDSLDLLVSQAERRGFCVRREDVPSNYCTLKK